MSLPGLRGKSHRVLVVFGVHDELQVRNSMNTITVPKNEVEILSRMNIRCNLNLITTSQVFPCSLKAPALS